MRPPLPIVVRLAVGALLAALVGGLPGWGSSSTAAQTSSPTPTVTGQASSLKLPFAGTWNVVQGDHPNLDGTGHNWDFQPPGAGSHNDQVLAVGAGTATVSCKVDGGTANVKLTVAGQTFGYGHLQASSVPALGHSWQVQQGAVLGRLFPQPTVKDPYSDACGTLYASHLHFGVPSIPITIDGTTFSSSGPSSGSVTSSNTPGASSGSVPSASMVTDSSDRVWMFSMMSDGSLFYRHTVDGPASWGSFNQVGDAGEWAPGAQVAALTDTRNRVWMFATKSDGRLFYRHTVDGPASWDSWHEAGDGGWSTTSTPSAVVDHKGRVWVFAVKSSGVLAYRHTLHGPSGWGSWGKVGRGKWSTTASPATVVDGKGRVWVFAVKPSGDLYYRHTDRGPTGWDVFHKVGSSHSTSASPSVTLDTRGRVWLVAVKSSGTAYYRHTLRGPNGWGSRTRLGRAASWSPNSTPEVTSDWLGRVWVVAAKANGRMYYRHTADGPGGWEGWHEFGAGHWSTVVSPVAMTDHSEQIWVVATKSSGRMFYRHASSSGWDDLHEVGSGGWVH